MKLFKHLMIVLALVLVVISCKKDEKSKTEMFTGKNWIMSAFTVDPAIDFFGIPISDFYAIMDDCDKDNFQRFESNGVYTMDEGATMCDSTNAQITTGTWAFNSNESILTITDSDTTMNFNIVEISDSKVILKYTEVTDSLTYTFTVTSILKP